MTLLSIHHMASAVYFCYQYRQYLQSIVDVLAPVLHDMLFFSQTHTVYSCLLDVLGKYGLKKGSEEYSEDTVLYVTALLSELHQYNMSCRPPYPQANYSKCRREGGERG